MKKTVIVFAGLGLLIALVFVSISNNVQAGFTVTKQPIAAGEWNTGTAVEVDLTAAPAPEWLQLMTTDAVVVKEPTEICHELGGGKFHWVGEIRQLQEGKWIKLKTNNGWVPDEEGAYMTCAEAPSAGTYALFAYYNGPQEFFTFFEEPTITPNATPYTCPTDIIVDGCTCPIGKIPSGGICIKGNL
ncbi:MAG: hypothetical protein Q8R87_04895 [Anaerolineaceae bacterium]|nr:hypothetical protein [Anaerolineaceae bacterium]